MTRQSAASDEPEDRGAAASYIAALSGDLALMARQHGLDTLGYILEMAKLEAENISRSQPQ
jgi:hypothetical protein